MHPSITLSALQDEVLLPVVPTADGAGGQARAGGALRVVVLPLASQTRRRGSTVSAPHTPFALPASFGNCLQWRVQAVGVIADVAIVTQQESSGVSRLPTGLTHGALQTPPTFAENHLSDLNTDAVWMVTLTTLRTGQQSSLRSLAKTATNHTHILMQSELVTTRKQHNCIVHSVFFFILI